MKLDRKELLKTLERAYIPASTIHADSQEASCFIFTGEDVFSSNGLLGLASSFKTDFTGIIPKEKLLEVLRKIKSKNVDINIKADTAIIETKQTKSNINIPDVETANDTVEKIKTLGFENIRKKSESLPVNFKKGIELCIVSTTDDDLNPFSKCLYIHSDKIISSDGLRIGMFNLDKKIKEKILLSNEVVLKLNKFEFKKYLFEKTDGRISFVDDNNNIAIARTINDEYPADLEKEFEFKGNRIKLPDDLESSINKALVFSEDDTSDEKEIFITIKKDEIICKSENDKGWIESKVEAKTRAKKEFSFFVNPDFFIYIIKNTSSITVGKDLIKFSVGDFQQVIMTQTKDGEDE